jgi:hypothetical protein
MRAMLLPVAALALAAGLGGTASADPLQSGGTSITRGGNCFADIVGNLKICSAHAMQQEGD